MVLDGRRMKVREIAETIGISKERVGSLEHRWNKCISLNGDYVEK
jgi:hypothetical protein